MKVTPISKENLDYFKGFISGTDIAFIEGGYRILPLGLVADDLEGAGNMAAGAICIRPDEYELKISSLYVSPAYRGRGAARFLLDEAKRLFMSEGDELDVEFLIYGKEEEALEGFLEHYGFVPADPEYNVFMVSVDEIKYTKLYDKKGKGVPFSEVGPEVLQHIQKNVERLGITVPAGGLASSGIDRDVSVMLVRDNIPEGFTVIEKLTDSTLLLSTVYANDNNPVILSAVLKKTAELLTKKYQGDTRLLIQAVEERGEMLIEQLFKSPENISYRYRFRNFS